MFDRCAGKCHNTGASPTTTVVAVPAASSRSVVDVNRLVDAARRRLPIVHFAVDSSLWVISIPLAVWLRYDYRFAELGTNLILPIVLAVALQGVFGLATGPLSAPVALRQLRRGAGGRARPPRRSA